MNAQVLDVLDMTKGDAAPQRKEALPDGDSALASRSLLKSSAVISACVGLIAAAAIGVHLLIPSLRAHVTVPEVALAPVLGLGIICYIIGDLRNPGRYRAAVGRPLFVVLAIYIVIVYAARLAAGGENAIISNMYVLWFPTLIAFGGLIIPFATVRRLSWTIYGAFGLCALAWIVASPGTGDLARLTRETQITAFLCLAILLLLLGQIASILDAALRDATLAREAAERANLAKSEFLARMSHDLRTPLNVVIGYSEVISGDVLGGREAWPRYRDYANDIRSSGELLLAIVNDILDIARIEAGGFTLRREPVDVDAVIAETFSRLSPSAARDGVVLVNASDGKVGTVMADRHALEQIMQNLLVNAIKFTPAGNHAGVRTARDRDSITIDVWDEGIGIHAAEILHLGEPFRKIGRAIVADKPGTGLGLAIVKNLVRMQGGTLAFESAVGVGTTARVTLPAKAPDPGWD